MDNANSIEVMGPLLEEAKKAKEEMARLLEIELAVDRARLEPLAKDMFEAAFDSTIRPFAKNSKDYLDCPQWGRDGFLLFIKKHKAPYEEHVRLYKQPDVKLALLRARNLRVIAKDIDWTLLHEGGRIDDVSLFYDEVDISSPDDMPKSILRTKVIMVNKASAIPKANA